MSLEIVGCHAASRMHIISYCKHTARHCTKHRRPLMFLLQHCSMWPQFTFFIVIEGNSVALIIPPPSPVNPKLHKRKSTSKASICIITCTHTHTQITYCVHTHMCTHREQEESWDSPKSLQNKPMAQRLAGSYFILFVILFSSHQKLSIGWQVVSRQFHLGCLSSLSVKGCLSHSFPPFPSLLCIIHHTLRLWQLQKKVEKKNHCVSQIGTCSAHDKVKWTVIYFIFAVVIVVIDMHIVLSPHLV